MYIYIYADDCNLKSHKSNQSIVNKNFTYLQKWFCDNYMALNPEKILLHDFWFEYHQK